MEYFERESRVIGKAGADGYSEVNEAELNSYKMDMVGKS